MAVVAATGVAEAIDAARLTEKPQPFDLPQQRFLDSFQPASRVSLESLEKAVFPFASGRGPEYLWSASPKDLRVLMIVCSCNVLSDDDVRNAVSVSEAVPRNAKQIYGCLGCSAECGRCARTIKAIIDEALGACAKACCSGCPHSRKAVADLTHADSHVHREFSLEAAS